MVDETFRFFVEFFFFFVNAGDKGKKIERQERVNAKVISFTSAEGKKRERERYTKKKKKNVKHSDRDFFFFFYVSKVNFFLFWLN